MKKVSGLFGSSVLVLILIGCGGSAPSGGPTPGLVNVATLTPSIAAPEIAVPTLTEVTNSTTVPTVGATSTPQPVTQTPVLSTAVPATVAPTPVPLKSGIELPQAAARVSLPIHILTRVGNPGDRVTAELRWKDGTLLQRGLGVVTGEDGRGLIVDTLGWDTESQPPQPPTQDAILSLRAADGRILFQQDQTALADSDPTTREITLYWVGGDKLYPVKRRVPKTAQIGTAALEELLWGPNPWNLAGFTTALPTPDEVLHSPNRKSDWGPRVTLNKLTIVGGVASADFSKEMGAFGGGSARVVLVRQQITMILKQFSTVKEVKISIDGQTSGILQP